MKIRKQRKTKYGFENMDVGDFILPETEMRSAKSSAIQFAKKYGVKFTTVRRTDGAMIILRVK